MLGKRKNKYSSGRHRILVVSVLCLFGFCLLAQVRPAKKGEQKPAKSKVYLLHSDVLKKSPLNPDPDAQILIGNVAFRHDSVYMYCDSACFYEKTNSLEAFDNVKMVQGDTLFLYGDYLFYDGNTQIAQVRYNVRMENKNTTLLTDSLNYDRIYNLGYYFDGGTLMDEENVLTSEWGEYSPATKISVFNYDVKLVNPKFTLTSDTLRYSTATKIANILGPSDIVSDANHIYSELGFYNTQIGQAAIVYTAPGIYEYTVTQDAGGRKRADYDDTVFYLKVMVAWDTDGELKGHVSVRRDGDDGAKTELLFKNSYRSTDPLPPPVTPPYVPDKPTPTPKPVEQPGGITVIRPPTPSAEMPDEVIPAAEPEPVGTLIQTGQLLWPVPVLAGGGIALVAVGVWLSRKRRHDA